MERQGKAWLWHGLGPSKNVLVNLLNSGINEASAGGRAGGGFSGALRPCLTKSKGGILLQSGDWGQGWTLFFSMEDRTGMWDE